MQVRVLTWSLHQKVALHKGKLSFTEILHRMLDALLLVLNYLPFCFVEFY